MTLPADHKARDRALECVVPPYLRSRDPSALREHRRGDLLQDQSTTSRHVWLISSIDGQIARKAVKTAIIAKAAQRLSRRAIKHLNRH